MHVQWKLLNQICVDSWLPLLGYLMSCVIESIRQLYRLLFMDGIAVYLYGFFPACASTVCTPQTLTVLIPPPPPPCRLHRPLHLLNHPGQCCSVWSSIVLLLLEVVNFVMTAHFHCWPMCAHIVSAYCSDCVG